jgi:hypothetical protein
VGQAVGQALGPMELGPPRAPDGTRRGDLLLGLPVGIGRLGGFRGLIPLGLAGTMRLIAIGAHRLSWRISPVATPWGQGERTAE